MSNEDLLRQLASQVPAKHMRDKVREPARIAHREQRRLVHVLRSKFDGAGRGAIEQNFLRSPRARVRLVGVGRDTRALRAEAPAVEVGM